MGERSGKAQQTGHDGGDGSADRRVSGRFDRPRQEILMAVVMLAAFVYMRVQIEDLVRGRRGAAFLDPDFWPGWLLNLLIVLALIYLGQAIMRARRPPTADVHAEPAAASGAEPAGTAGELAADADDAAGAEPLAATDAQAKDPADGPHDSAVRKNPLMLLAGFGLIFAFVWLMPRIGFIPSGLLFAVAFLLAVGERRWSIVTSIPIVLMALILYVFTRLLVVPLPRGRGFFLEFSTYFY